MRKVLYILLSLLLCAAGFSCTRQQEDEPFLEISRDEITFGKSADTQRFDIEANVGWECEISPPIAREWLSVDRRSGGPGKYTVSVNALQNDTQDKREATIYVDARDISKSVAVTQSPIPEVEVSQSIFNVRQKGDEIKVVVVANTELDVKIFGDWIHNITSVKTRSLAPVEFKFEIDANPTYGIREGKIAFSADDGLTSDTVYVRQDAAVYPLEVKPSVLDFTVTNTTAYLEINSTEPDWSVEITTEADWCTAVKEGAKRVLVRAKTNLGAERSANIRITAGEYAEDVTLTQQAFDPDVYYGDRQVFRLRQATVGNGIDIIVLGDGYTVEELAKKGGKYEKDMRGAADHFFSTYPYSAYRDYFNVYMVTAISEEAGMSSVSPSVKVDTKFETLWQGTSTTINCKDATVRQYASAVTSLTGRRMQDMTVIMPINRNVYAGTCLMWSDGFSIAMIPVGTSFGKLVVHEAGGHGFAKLIDEYIYNKEPIPADTKSTIQNFKKWYGFYINADFSDNILETTWSGFANNPKYPMVGTYEGAYMYSTGIWRPERNSCMNDNVLYFNAPSRWAQVKRIHELAGLEYSFEQFLLDDEIPPYLEAAKAAGFRDEPFVPSGPPVVITTPSELD